MSLTFRGFLCITSGRWNLLPSTLFTLLFYPKISKWRNFHPIRWIRWIGQIHSCMNYDPFTVSHRHRRHFSEVVNMPDCCASDQGSIPEHLPFFENFILLNSSNLMRLMKKLDCFPCLFDILWCSFSDQHNYTKSLKSKTRFFFQWQESLTGLRLHAIWCSLIELIHLT